MALGFSVSNLGPLSQIGFELQDVGTAIYLAKQAYGWYKSRDRALSFEQTLASGGASLATVSTFNRITYNQLRQDYGGIWGVARGIDGLVARFRLPKASTALEGDPGLVCLRALTLGLDCFVREEQICLIFRLLLPKHLLHLDQEGKEVTIEGPFLVTLKDYIGSTIREESADVLRAHLLDHVGSQIQRVTSATLENMLASRKPDIGHVLGFLDWLLTPVSRRESSVYPTRSLEVWSLALTLSDLGFEVEAERTSPHMYPASMNDHSYNKDSYSVSRVSLVLLPGISTDYGRNLFSSNRPGLSTLIVAPPRVLPVRAYPAAVYTDLVSAPETRILDTDAKDLEEAFLDTFRFVRSRLALVAGVRRAAGLHLLTANNGPENLIASSNTLSDSCESFLQAFRNMYPLWKMHPSLKDSFFSKSSSSASDMMDLIIASVILPMISRHLVPWSLKHDEEVVPSEASIMFVHIMVSSTLAALSLFVRSTRSTYDDEDGLGMQFIYKRPRIGLPHFAAIMSYICEFSSWNPVEESLTLTWSIRFSKLVAEIIFDESIYAYGADEYDEHGKEQSFLGATKYGLVLLSEFIIRPSTQQSAFLVLHSFPGQLLDIPTQGGFVIDGQPPSVEHQYIPYDTALRQSDASAIKTALSVENFQPSEGVRVDLEPCWDNDPAQCQFVIRAGGLSIFQISIHQLMNLVSKANIINCSVASLGQHLTPDIITELMFLDKREWYYFDNPMAITRGPSGSNLDNATNTAQQNVLFRVGKDERLLMLALALYPQHTHYITNCLGVIMMKLKLWAPCASEPLLIILYEEQHNHFLNQQGDEPVKGDGLLLTAAFLIYQPYNHHTAESILEPISHLIWKPTEVGYPYGREVVTRIRDTIRHCPGSYHNWVGETGIIEESIVTLLRALDLDSIVDAALGPKRNRNAINKRLDILLGEMQANIPKRMVS